MIIIGLLAVTAGLVVFNIATLYELRRIDTELRNIRHEAWRARKQMNWLIWIVRRGGWK